MVSAELTLYAGSAANWPVISWQYGDVFPDPNDPAQRTKLTRPRIQLKATAFSRFTGSSSSPAKCPIKTTRACAGCLDDSGTAGFAPEPLTDEGLRGNRSFGLGWLNVATTMANSPRWTPRTAWSLPESNCTSWGHVVPRHR